MCIRLARSVHPTQKKCASELQNLCIRPTKVVYPTYKIMCIRLTKSVHLTYKIYKSCSSSDIQNLCIRPAKSVHPIYLNRNIYLYGSTVNYILTISAVPAKFGFTKSNVYPTYSCRRSDVAQVRIIVGRKYCRTEVTLPVKDNNCCKNLSSSISLAWLESDLKCLKCLKFLLYLTWVWVQNRTVYRLSRGTYKYQLKHHFNGSSSLCDVGGGSAEVNKRHPNVFCGMRTPKLVIRNKKLTINRFFH